MWLSNVGALITLGLGCIAVFKPQAIEQFVSVEAIGKEGKSEIRATYGGFFVAFALMCLWHQETLLSNCLGFCWLMAGLVRLISLFTGSFSLKNLGGVAFECGIGALCLGKMLASV